MPIAINDFFRPLDLRNGPTAEDYDRIRPFITVADAFSQLTYQSLYIIDYYKKGFAYVSNNPLFLCGKSPREVMRAGYSFYLDNVPQTDLNLLLEINEAGFKFYKNIPVEDRLSYMITYDFHLIQSDNNFLLINHKLTPLMLDKDANIWLALCVVSLSSNDKAGNIMIRKKNDNKFYKYDPATKEWKDENIVILNKREKEILILSGEGLTMDKISKNLYLSIDTIKFHKKNIFKKLKVKNIPEAILFASNYGII